MNIYFIYIIVVTLLFVIYIELSVGGIALRVNSYGGKSLNLYSLLSYLVHPIHNSFLWNKNLLDVNYIFILSISSFLYYILKLIIYY